MPRVPLISTIGKETVILFFNENLSKVIFVTCLSMLPES